MLPALSWAMRIFLAGENHTYRCVSPLEQFFNSQEMARIFKKTRADRALGGNQNLDKLLSDLRGVKYDLKMIQPASCGCL